MCNELLPCSEQGKECPFEQDRFRRGLDGDRSHRCDFSFLFNIIQSVLDELAAGRPEKTIVAVEKRREELTRTSWSCIEALASFQHYVSEFGPQPSFVSR